MNKDIMQLSKQMVIYEYQGVDREKITRNKIR